MKYKDHESPVVSSSKKSEDEPKEKALLLGHADRVGRERKEVSNGGFEVKDYKEEKIMKKTEPHLVLLVV